LVSAGDHLKAGQPIATVGSTGGQSQSALYFALRQQGQATDPGQWCRSQGRSGAFTSYVHISPNRSAWLPRLFQPSFSAACCGHKITRPPPKVTCHSTSCALLSKSWSASEVPMSSPLTTNPCWKTPSRECS